MKTAPIAPGRLAFSAEGLPFAPDFDDVYHPAAGALTQARHVFLAGNGLPARWQGRDDFAILETGFGLGNNFLATWDAWQRDPQRCTRLHYVAIEKHPLSRADLARAQADSALPGLPRLAAELLAAWPPSVPNLHPLRFDGGRVQLLLGFGDIALLLPQLVAAFDAFYLDGFAPARNPAMWEPRRLQRLGRLAAPGATAATWSAARVVREALTTAGFQVETAAGTGGKRDITVARFAPRHRAASPPGGRQVQEGAREALVIGAGLAGCAAAWGLAQQGWRSTVLDAEATPAAATSGNAAGLFHGSVHADDGPHARAHRAAALLTQRVAAPWIAEGRVAGQLAGCLRLESRLTDAQALALIEAQKLPPDALSWLDHEAAAAVSGIQVPSGGWWFPGGGWLAPRDYAAALLAESGAAFRGGCRVASLRRERGLWQAFGAAGELLASAPVLVLTNALDAQRLLGADAALPPDALTAVRGQLSGLPTDRLPALQPRVPVAGSGYVLPPIEGRLLFGATSQPGDLDPALREADHHHNLAQLARLAGGKPGAWQALPWTGRVGWRAVTPDRLPLVGALPDPAALALASRADQPRFVPRLRDAEGGLYLCTGLGSRGIAWAALAGQLLASWVSGAPCPLEADLRDALDPARLWPRRR